MDRGAILETARTLTMGVKAQEHGNGSDSELRDNFNQIAALWSAYLGHDVSLKDVAQMMVLLKMSRARQNPKHADHYIDAAAYSAIAGELALPLVLKSSIMEQIAKDLKEGTFRGVIEQNAEAATSVLDGQSFIEVRGMHVTKGIQVKLFATDEIWDVEEVLLSDSGLHMVRVRHYPSNREHEMLAKHIHSVVGA